MAIVKLGDFVVTLNGELPEVGSQLPDFLLADGDLNNVCLEQFKGKGLVLNIFNVSPKISFDKYNLVMHMENSCGVLTHH